MNSHVEIEDDFSWIPNDNSWNRNPRQYAKKYFQRRIDRQPFQRRGSIPASVERYIGLENLHLMLGRGFDDDKFKDADQRTAARDQADLSQYKRLLKRGGGAARGLVTQTASVDDLRARYFQPRSELSASQPIKHRELTLDQRQSPVPEDLNTAACQRCLGINAENLSASREYVHSTLFRLISSSSKCRLCKLIFDMLGISSMGLTLTRYRIVLTIEERSPFLDVQDRCIAVDDHEADTRNHLSEITVQFQDLTPWEKPEHYLFEYDGEVNETRSEKATDDIDCIDEAPTEDNVSVLEPSQLQDKFGWYKKCEDWRLRPKTVRTEQGLRCFTEECDPARILVKGISWIRPLGRNTASPASFDVAVNWLERCIAEDELLASNHATNDHREPNYSPPSSPIMMFPFDDNGNFVGEDNSDGVFPHRRLETLEELPNIQEEKPSRLLQINEDATSIRLIDTCGNPFSYVALSYCWGKDDGGDWKTTTHTLRSHTQHGLASKYLPLTLQHSLTITRRLGFSYIWIDALCIIQDSSEDWAREATKMAGVYFGSVLTIAASAAHSWSDGCFNQHSTRIIERGLYSDSWVVVESELSTGQSSRLYVLSTDALRFGEHTDTYYSGVWERYHRQLSGIAYSSLVHDSPLAKRGWTFQEHRLPRRTLYYTAEQLFWECQHCRRSEDNFPIQQNLGKHPILDTKRLTSDGVATLWYLGVVEDYSRRALTFSKDRLVAVSALAKATYFRRPQPYIAGLWRDSMMDGLMWRRTGHGHKSNTSQVPSWSWASQESAVQFVWTKPGVEQAINWLTTYKPTITNVSWEPSPISPFSDVLSASINLKTRFTTGTIFYHTHRRNGGENVQGFSGWSGHSSAAEARWEEIDGNYKPYSELEQGLYISSSTTDSIWYLEAAMDSSNGSHWGEVLVAVLGFDNSDTQTNLPDLEPQQNNNNLVFLLLDPPALGAAEYKRVGIARFRSTWARSAEIGDWRLRGVREHPMQGWEERTIRLV